MITGKDLVAGDDERLARARCSLEGLSVGDALGQHVMVHLLKEGSLPGQELPPSPWYFTDDTYMALSIISLLCQNGEIDQDRLAADFALRYQHDAYRGYGPGMHALLQRINNGQPWREPSPWQWRQHGPGACASVRCDRLALSLSICFFPRCQKVRCGGKCVWHAIWVPESRCSLPPQNWAMGARFPLRTRSRLSSGAQGNIWEAMNRRSGKPCEQEAISTPPVPWWVALSSSLAGQKVFPSRGATPESHFLPGLSKGLLRNTAHLSVPTTDCRVKPWSVRGRWQSVLGRQTVG